MATSVIEYRQVKNRNGGAFKIKIVEIFSKNNGDYQSKYFMNRSCERGNASQITRGRLQNESKLGQRYLHHEGAVPMLFFDLISTPTSTNAFILLFWNNIDDYPLHLKWPKTAIFRLTANSMGIDCYINDLSSLNTISCIQLIFTFLEMRNFQC